MKFFFQIVRTLLTTTHQAFYTIKAERKGKQLLQPKGKGSSSMLRCLLENQD